MTRVWKVIKWGAVGVATVMLLGVAALLVVGVPKPPTLTTENVPRLPIRYLVDNIAAVRAIRASKSFGAWMPDGGMLVRANRGLLDSRLHHIGAHGATPRFIEALPRNVSTIASDPARAYLILAWDRGGDERYQLYRWTPSAADDAAALVRLTDGSERAVFGAFEPDGSRIAYTSTRRNGTDTDIYVADPSDTASTRLVRETEGTWHIHDWSPAGARLAITRFFSSAESHLYVLDLDSNALRLVSDTTGNDVSHGAVHWSADGRGLYFISDRDSEFQRLRHLDLESGAETVLSGDLPWDVEGVQRSHDRALLVLQLNEDGRHVYYRYDVAGGALEPLDLFEADGLGSAVLHPTQPVLAVTHVDAAGIGRVYTHELDTSERTYWVGDSATSVEVAPLRTVRYSTFDSVNGAARQIPALVYPGVGEGPRPVVITIHGGPASQARAELSRWVAYQRKGITVIAPNIRGSTGYGKTYQSLDDQHRRADAVRDIGALLDWIAANPSLDERRVFVTGGSYGGYMVLASLVHFGDRIRCGADWVGVSNFVTFLESTADYRRDLRRLEYGDERDPEMRAFLESVSPLNHAERIVSPLMVVQGANDPRVPVTESRQLVERARRNGTPVRYIEGANEGHGFINPWNAVYAAVAELQFTDECLGIDQPAL